MVCIILVFFSQYFCIYMIIEKKILSALYYFSIFHAFRIFFSYLHCIILPFSSQYFCTYTFRCSIAINIFYNSKFRNFSPICILFYITLGGYIKVTLFNFVYVLILYMNLSIHHLLANYSFISQRF